MDQNELASLRMNPGQEVTLHPSKLKWGCILFICTGAAVMGGFMTRDDPRGWAALVVFGILAFFAFRQLYSGKSYLRLTAGGFQARSLFLNYDATWNDIGNIGVVYYRRNTIVVFDYLSPSSGNARRRARNKRVLDYDESIPETYGLDAKELAELLASRRDAVAPLSRP